MPTSCNNSSYDNRETCVSLFPSSCVPYVGYVSPALFPEGLCRPNINDIFKKLQQVIDKINAGLGDNTTLDKKCLSFVPETATQRAINQDIITELCLLKEAVDLLEEGEVDPDKIFLTVNLLCLLDPTCKPKTKYTLTEIITKLIVGYCGLIGGSTSDSEAGEITPGATALNNYSIASQFPAAGVRTYIVGSQIGVPSGGLQVGTMFRWTFDISKTAAGSLTSTFNIAVGTAGTVADSSRITFVKPAGTADVDNGRITIEAIVRGPLSTLGVISGHFNMTHNLLSTGHAIIPVIDISTLSAPFDVTTSSLFVGLCITAGTGDIITIQQVMTETWNL